MSAKKVIVKQVRSTNNREKETKATLQALGLGKIGRERQHVLTPATAGMLRAVQHMIVVHEAK